MISWIVVLILIVTGIFAIKLNHLRHRFLIIVLLVIALFLYTTMNLVSTENNLDFKTTEGVFHSIKVYIGWLANGFDNLKELTGQAINLDWSKSNASFFDKNNSNSTKK